ncbi:MAG: hypothetical protein EOM74_00870 [Methanomicrobia archaeon]|nr:hypothetical protein [Methanomicrobia archaeon]
MIIKSFNQFNTENAEIINKALNKNQIQQPKDLWPVENPEQVPHHEPHDVEVEDPNNDPKSLEAALHTGGYSSAKKTMLFVTKNPKCSIDKINIETEFGKFAQACIDNDMDIIGVDPDNLEYKTNGDVLTIKGIGNFDKTNLFVICRHVVRLNADTESKAKTMHIVSDFKRTCESVGIGISNPIGVSNKCRDKYTTYLALKDNINAKTIPTISITLDEYK